MFGLKRLRNRLDFVHSYCQGREADCRRENAELRRRLDALMAYLNLSEAYRPGKHEVFSKGGPEPGE